MTVHFATTSLLAGVDPGLASGGLVILDVADRERVLEAFSLVEKGRSAAAAKERARLLAKTRLNGWSDLEFLAADLRAAQWLTMFATALDLAESKHGPVSVFAVESFVDQKQHAKKMMKNRWQTPLVIGRLAGYLQTSRNITPENGRLVYQNAGTVLKQHSDEIARLQARSRNDRDLIVPGDRQITNEHLRSALAHALALAKRVGPATLTPVPLSHHSLTPEKS